MSINTIENKTIEILVEIQKMKCAGRPRTNERELDRIKNAIVRKLVNHEIFPEYLNVESIATGCGILTVEAEEIYHYLKTVELI